MKCTACGYFNMPSATACGRCGRSLVTTPSGPVEFAEIYPPRAARGAARWTLQELVRRVCESRAAQRLTPIGAQMRAAGRPAIDWKTSLSTSLGFVPGLGALIQGRRIDAAWQSAVGAGLVLIGLTCITSEVSDLAGAALLGWMVYTAYDTLKAAYPLEGNLQASVRRLRFMVGGTAIVAANFAACVILVDQIYQPYTITDNSMAPAFHAGDTVVRRDYGAKEPVRRGDVIVGDWPNNQVNTETDEGIVFSGYLVDRVVGVPGDAVSVHGGVVSVNGNAISRSRYPLSSMKSLNYDGTVPNGCVCLLRSFSAYQVSMSPAIYVSNGAIEGKAVAIVEPAVHRRLFP